jgi:eukaryotic-like serine/threonine-protein kinase
MSLTLGLTLHNRYRIDALLGQGGMGAVYRAWDLNLDIAVVVKENLGRSPDAHKQFAREAGLLAGLRHPNLPRVTDHFFLPGQGQYLVMDYIEGEDLDQILARRGAIPETAAVSWISRVLDALEYLHGRNVIHRDVKPANIKICPDGQVFLVDFGLAKLYDPLVLTTTGARGVTPGYAPLEQYGEGRTDARSDVYSAGATLFALLTGQAPPQAPEVATGAAQLLSPRQVRPGLSPDVSAAVLRAMQTRPADRFQTAAEFREALTRPPLRTTRPGVAPSPASTAVQPHSIPSSAPRHWLVWPLVGGAGVLLVALIVAVVLLLGGGGSGGAATSPATAAAVTQGTPLPAPTALPLALLTAAISSGEPARTPLPPTPAPLLPSDTARPTATPLPPTATPVPPTATSVPPTATRTPVPQEYSNEVVILAPRSSETIAASVLTVRWIGPAPQAGYIYRVAVTERPKGWAAAKDGQFQTKEVRSSVFSVTFRFDDFGLYSPGFYDVRVWLMKPPAGADQFEAVDFIWQPAGP